MIDTEIRLRILNIGIIGLNREESSNVFSFPLWKSGRRFDPRSPLRVLDSRPDVRAARN